MDDYLLIHGDARKLPVDPSMIDAVVSDPPYGMTWCADSTRFTGGYRSAGDGRSDWGRIIGDDKPFNPSPWLAFPKVILFGSNYYAAQLPIGTTLVWIKKYDHLFGSFLSDAEIAWMKGSHGVYCFRDATGVFGRQLEAGGRAVHPTQKPIRLFRWCIQKLKLPPRSLILDPYMGSGTTGIAALQLGHRFIGIDIERKYVEIAKRRLERPHAPIQRATTMHEDLPLFKDLA